MPDLGDELRTTIDGAASPVTFEEVVDRSSTSRSPRRPWRTFVAAAVVVALVVVGAVIVSSLGDDESSSKPHIAAPSVVVGDIDLAVLSTSFDSDGARGPIDASVVDTVRAVPGVAGAQGAMQRFVDVVRPEQTANTQLWSSQRQAIAISWEEGAPLTFSAGGPPQQAGEIAINPSLAARYDVGVGDELVVRSGPTPLLNVAGGPNGSTAVTDPNAPPASSSSPTVRVVGVFALPSGDVDGMNLVIMRAEDLGAVTRRSSFDRIDIAANDGVPIDELLDRIQSSMPAGTMVVPPSVIGFDDTLRAELEIQRDYNYILGPDRTKAQQSSDFSPEGAAAEQNQRNWDENLWQTVNTELRVSRVTFVDSATALVTYRAYYGGQPSQVVRDPMTAVAERIDGQWRLSGAGLCELAQAANVQGCVSSGGPLPSWYSSPPNGWNAVASVPGVADAFRVVANPASTVDQRVAVVDQGEKLRDAI